MIRVEVNGDVTGVEPGATVAGLLGALGVTAQRGVAVARNGEVVRRAAWSATTLADGDRVEVVHAVQGGA